MMTNGLLRHWAAWVCAGVLVVAASSTAYGDTDWIHDPNEEGDWFDENNWDRGVPDSKDSVVIHHPCKIAITSGDATVGRYFELLGEASLRQTGGTLTIYPIRDDSWLALGYGSVTTTYELSGGCLTVTGDEGAERIAFDESTAQFIHTGGTNTTPILAVGVRGGIHDPGRGIYDLSGSGELFADQVYLGYDPTEHGDGKPGEFRQSGGVSHPQYVFVAEGSRYELTGGTLELDGGMTLRGELDFGGQSPVLDIRDGSILNLGKGTVLNAEQAALNLGPTSLCIVPEGFDPATEFGQYVNQGKTHTAGNTLEIAAGETISGWGAIDDRVVCAGSLLASEGGVLELTGGLSIAEGGIVDVGETTLWINDETSGMTGGELLCEGPLVLSSQASARFVQEGGICSTRFLYVFPGSSFDAGSGCEGTYELRSGHLITERSRVHGFSGPAEFIQMGGTHTTDLLSVREAPYILSGGVLEAAYASFNSWEVTDAAAEIRIGRRLTVSGPITAVEGTTVHMLSTPGEEPDDPVGFQTHSTDPAAQAGLGNVRLIFEGGTGATNSLEVAGLIDGGFTENFALGALQVGGASGFGTVRLVDEIDNGFRLGAAAEALFVDELLIGADSLLAVDGLRLYVAHDVKDLLDTYIADGRLADARQPAQPILAVYNAANDWTVVIPEPATLSLLALGALAGVRKRRRQA